MTIEMFRELALEHRFTEVKAETPGMYSFVRDIARGRCRINYADEQQILTLIICKEQKGFHNFRKTFPTHDYNLVYEIFHHYNRFRTEK